MRILTRYIFVECCAFFGVCLLAFTGMLVTLRILRLSDLVINRGVGLEHIVMVFVAIIPTFLEFAVPLAALLGIMLAFARLSGDSEIVVLRSSGVSLSQTLYPVALFGLAAAALSLYVSLSLRPWGYRKLSDTLFEIARSKSTAGIEAGVFNKLGDVELYTENIEYSTDELTHVLVDDRRDDKNRKVIFATRGVILSDAAAQTISFRLFDGVIHENMEGHYVLTHFKQNDVTMQSKEMYANTENRRERRSVEMGLPEIQENIEAFKGVLKRLNTTDVAVLAQEPSIIALLGGKELTKANVTRKLNRMRIERAQRFSMPFASFVLALLGMTLGIQPPRMQRTWGIGLSVTLGMFVFVCYYVLLSVSSVVAESGQFNPNVGVWIPNVVATSVTLITTYKICTERWQSIAHGFENILSTLVVKLRLAKLMERL